MRIMGIHNTGSAVKNHISGKRIDCNISNHVPFVVAGLSTSSSTTPTPTSSSSSSQESTSENRDSVSENRDRQALVSEEMEV